MKGQPITTNSQLHLELMLKYRFIKTAASDMGFISNRDYQRFRNTVLGGSRDLQVICRLVQAYPMIDAYKVWGVRLH